MVAAGKSSFRSTHSKQQLFCRSTVPSNNDTTTGGGDGTLNQTLFYMEDANVNVTGLVNTSGTVVERYAYSPYGQPKFYDGSWNSRTSSNYSIRILYAGYRWIQETGLYDVRHRMLNPSLGKWMQRDPMGYVDGMSLYQYCGSEPVGWVDPTGTTGLGASDLYNGLFGGNADQPYYQQQAYKAQHHGSAKSGQSRGRQRPPSGDSGDELQHSIEHQAVSVGVDALDDATYGVKKTVLGVAALPAAIAEILNETAPKMGGSGVWWKWKLIGSLPMKSDGFLVCRYQYIQFTGGGASVVPEPTGVVGKIKYKYIKYMLDNSPVCPKTP